MSPAVKMSARAGMVETLKRLIGEVRGGRYTPHRGPVPVTWSFQRHPYPVAITFDQLTPWSAGKVGASASIMLQAMARPSEDPAGFPQPEETLLDEMQEDLERVLSQLPREASALFEGEPVVFGVQQIEFSEGFDADQNIQGVTARFLVTF